MTRKLALGGVILDFELTSAKTDERQVALELLERHHDLEVLGNKEYVDQPKAEYLVQKCGVKLETLPRRNQKRPVSPAYQKWHNGCTPS